MTSKRKSGPKQGSKEAKIQSLTQRLLNLDVHADKLAIQSKFQELACINAQMDELAEELEKLGVHSEEALEAAKNGGMKAQPVKGISSSKPSKASKSGVPWYDDDDPGYMDTGLQSWSGYTGGSGKGSYKKCAHDHPLLSIADPDGVVLEIQGGSCYSPQGMFEVEIFLCSGASLPSKIVPWQKETFVRYPIVDMQAPADKDEFDRLIDWTIEQMRAGRKVHVGCIGGHGRTGTFLSVLVHKITGRTDSSQWLRDNYCKKAVESQTQIDWLHKHYGIEKVKPGKTYTSYKSEAKTKGEKKAVSQLSFGGQTSTWSPETSRTRLLMPGSKHDDSRIATPLPGKSVWGSTVVI